MIKFYISKKIIILYSLFFYCLCSWAEKNDNLLFHASFDNNSNANVAKGEPGALNLSNSMLMKKGIKNTGLLVGRNGRGERKYCKYKAENNISLEKGAISLWVKPLTWNGKDISHQIFFSGKGPSSRFMIYKYQDCGAKSPSSGHLLFMFGSDKKYILAGADIRKWKKNDWHHIACNWNKESIRLYIDGTIADTKKISEFPDTPLYEFAVGELDVWQNSRGMSIVDELKIYSSELSAKDIYKEWKKHSQFLEPEKAFFASAVTRTKKSPNIDGKIQDKEYSFSATGFLDIRSGNYADIQSRYFLSYDDENIYIGVMTPILKEHCAKEKERDGEVCSDDSVEIFLKPSSHNEYFQFIFNSIGTLYDGIGFHKRWNSDNIKYVSEVSGNNWIIEMALPFKDLNVAAPNNGELWRINICRTFTYPKRSYTSISKVKNSYHAVKDFMQLLFCDKIPEIRLNSIGPINNGELNLKLNADKTALTEKEKICVAVNLTAEENSVLNYSKSFKNDTDINIAFNENGFKKKGTLSIELSSEKYGKLYSVFLPFDDQAHGKFKLEYMYTEPDGKSVNFGLTQQYPLWKDKAIDVNIRFFDETGRIVLEKSFQEEEKYKFEVGLDISSLNPGDYTVEVSFSGVGKKELACFKETYRKYSTAAPPPWIGNKIGITTDVPPPWTALKVYENTVKCWGREYVFDNNFLPSQIISQGQEILAAPIYLSAVIDKKNIKGIAGKIKWTEKHANKVSFSGEGQLGSVKFYSIGYIEYDGFVWVKIILDAKHPVNIEKLALTIPFKKNAATLRNFCEYRLEGTGISPHKIYTKNLVVDKPIFWLGNENVGLQWFAENLKNWHLRNPERSLEIRPQEKEVAAKLNIIDNSLILDGRREISFGFQATPVKPKPAAWRKWRIKPWGSKMPYNLRIWFTLWTELMNYPDSSQVKQEKINELRSLEAKGIQVTPYLSLIAVTPHSREYKYYGDLWREFPQERVLFDSALDPQTREWAHYYICPNSSSYRDFYLWKLKETVHTFKLKGGFYFDHAMARSCSNNLHGCSWLDDNGKTRKNFTILGLRKLAKRIYVMMKKYNPDSIILHHMSGETTMPIHAFSDIMVDGENLAGKVGQDESYYNVLPLDKFKAQYMSRQWGPAHVVIPQLMRASGIFKTKPASYWSSKEARKPINHFIGLSLVHDGILWPSWEIKLDKLWTIQDKLGWDEKLEFIPYWNNSEYLEIISPKDKNVVVSAYKKEGKILLVPFNNTDKDIELKIKLKKGKYTSFTDQYEKKNFIIRDRILEFPLKARNYRLLGAE